MQPQLAEARSEAAAAATSAADAATALEEQTSILKAAEEAMQSLMARSSEGEASAVTAAEVEAAMDTVRAAKRTVSEARRSAAIGTPLSPARAAAHARAATSAAGGTVSQEPVLVELLAEYAIEGAKSDSVMTNP